MSRRLFDITKQMTNGIDFEIHKKRGQDWCDNLKRKYKGRKETAAAMLRNDKPNNIFVIARVCHLDIMTVREIEDEYLEELKRKEAEV